MRKYLFIILLSLSSLSMAQVSDLLTDSFLGEIACDDYPQAVSYFTEEVLQSLDAEKLQKKIESLSKLHGDLLIRKKTIKTFYNEHDIVIRYVWFGDQGYKLYFEIEQSKISAFFIANENITNTYSLPDYAEGNKVKIKPLLIQSKNYGITGEMVCPIDVSDYPVVVIASGSGPNNRDEGLYGNRTLRDVAYGLAAKGIATVRFEKNSYLFAQYILKEKQYTVWDEYGVDILNIVDFLNKQEQIPAEQIFLMGHSQGAMILPRLLDSIDVAGGIMIAGNARPLEELLYEQMLFFAKRDGYSDSDKRRMKILEEQIENLEILRDMDPEQSKMPLPFSLSAYYWKDLLDYNQVKTLQQVDEPILLLQGEGDYQVKMKDYNMFKKALKKRGLPFVAKSYPEVNHLLFENQGKDPSPEEYKRNDHVEKYIIDDIGCWIKANLKVAD